jgi:hypothetical protein
MTRDQKEDLLRRQRETREDDALTEAARRLLERIEGDRA